MARAELGLVAFEHLRFIKIGGLIHPKPEGFSVYLNGEEGNVLLHLDVHYNAEGGSGHVVLNSKKNGQWGQEISERDFPFKPSGPLDIEIHFKEGYEIKVYGKDFAKFPYRFPMSHAKRDGQLYIRGDVSISELKLVPK